MDSVPPESPHERGKDGRRRRLEGVIPEIVRRAVELGVEKAQEAPDNLKSFVGDLKLPKDIAHYLLQQIDETKNGLFRVVAKEIRDFLEHTNFAGEVQKLLTTVQFEVNTTIRFTPNDGRTKTSKSKSDDESDDGDETAPADEDDAGEAGERRLTPLPKPEVKTAVHVRRDDRERRRRRDRDP
ncbi:MAG: hypothetical protein KF764_28520 [Labilithrix sp.]|nr:hypothetical protein [Labilithrix sp.]MBX3223985.1 hypothetical protein [Labilithrix sp.]